jgi:hypothetical protein
LVLVGSQLLVFGLRLPVAEVIFGVVQDLTGLGAVGVWLALVAWHYGGVVQELEEAAAVAGQDDLLLGTLDRGEEFGVVGFLELLAGLTQRKSLALASWYPEEGTTTMANKTEMGLEK